MGVMKTYADRCVQVFRDVGGSNMVDEMVYYATKTLAMT